MKGEPINISLTGKDSHSITIPLGQGSFAIGGIGMDAKKYDVLVNTDLPINWNSFNTFFTPHGKTHQSLNPYGDWPRFFYYWGNDSNFIQWSEKRAIEDFTWSPLKALSADFTKSKINRLVVNTSAHKLNLILGNHRSLTLSGNLENININKSGKIDAIAFYPTKNIDSDSTYQLAPTFEALSDVTSLDININPLDEPFDCESILQFKNVTNLSLSGNFTNLHCLENLVNLERLAIRYAPNLENLPALMSWKKLNSFIGWNIEDTKGKLLRSELKKLGTTRKLEYSSVSQLRKSIWFITEYGIPFSAWEGKSAKTAIKSYKATLKKLKKVKTEKEAKDLLIAFTQVFNDLPQIETTEREDIGEAIEQLRQIPNVEIDSKKANKWFDETRDY